MTQLVEDPKVKGKKALCLATEVLGGHEFICILNYHGSEFDNNGNRNPWNNSRGAPSKWRRHFFRRHYPYGNH